jgi:hypothetical protein
MPPDAHRMFLLRVLSAGWCIPLILLTLPVVTFNYADPFWMTVALATVGAVFAACWMAEGSPSEAFNQPWMRELPPVGQCRRAALVFSVLTCIGSMLILFDQRESLGTFENLQEKYLALVEIRNSGDRPGTVLSTIGTALRSFVYVAIVGFVAQTAQTRNMRQATLPLLLLLAAMALSAVATASRTYLIFCVLVAVMSGLLLRHPLLKRPGILLGVAAACSYYLMLTTNQRIDAAFGDVSPVDVLTYFFDAELGSLGNFITNHTGAGGLAAVLYLSHPLPEFSRIVAEGSTQYALGAHSLYLIYAPALRLFGIDIVPDVDLVQRPGMWWGTIGDLYMDFGPGFVVAYPLMIFLIVRVTKRIGRRTVYGLSLQCVTAAMLFASPFFGVMNTYSFSYFGLLALAWWQKGRIRRPVAQTPLRDIAAPR